MLTPFPSAIRLLRGKTFVEARQCRSRFAFVKLNGAGVPTTSQDGVRRWSASESKSEHESSWNAPRSA